MTTWREFLLENAKFPFPNTTGSNYANSADINPLLIGSIPKNFKARYAVPDVTLVEKLCETLDEILGDTPISRGSMAQLLSMFGRHLEFRTFDGVEIGITSRRILETKLRYETWILILWNPG
jgi:hypothetical protein